MKSTRPSGTASSADEQQRESSVLFSLNELASIENQRQKDEADAVRARADAEARARREEADAEVRRQREHEERLRRIAAEEAIERARHEERVQAAEQSARQETERRQQLQAELAEVQRSRRELELRAALSGPARTGRLVGLVVAAVVVVGGALGFLMWRSDQATRAALDARRVAGEASDARIRQQAALSEAELRTRTAEQALQDANAKLRQRADDTGATGAGPAGATAANSGASAQRTRRPVAGRARPARPERSLEQLDQGAARTGGGRIRKGPVVIDTTKGPLGDD
jgi:hypothetical protein